MLDLSNAPLRDCSFSKYAFDVTFSIYLKDNLGSQTLCFGLFCVVYFTLF